MDLNSLIIIEKIASLGSFSAAAKALRIPASNLSLKVKQLEEELGQPVFSRTTRKVVITEFGKRVRGKIAPLIGLEEDIKSLADSEAREPTGVIRITTAFDIGLFLMRETVPAFLNAHPKLDLEVDLTNQYRNIVDEGFDFAIRAARSKLADIGMVAIKLGTSEMGLYARRGDAIASSSRASDIRQARVLTYEGHSPVLSNGKREYQLQRNERLVVGDMAGVRHALMGLGGLAILPEFTCTDTFSQSQIVRVLPEWSAGKASIYAICPSKRALTTKSRLLLEYLKHAFGT